MRQTLNLFIARLLQSFTLFKKKYDDNKQAEYAGRKYCLLQLIENT